MTAVAAEIPERVIVRLPTPHAHQRVFLDWNVENPKAQCLIAPCGTKVGKSFGSALWLTTEALTHAGLFCVWIAPTYLKAQIGYRYIKAMLPDNDLFKCIDSRLEIRIANGTVIKFLHGRDAETTIEGEAIDRFVIDESGKIDKQVFHSLLTTITQTRGLGICTGTPRGFTWYYDMFRKAQAGDPFFVWAKIRTIESPYVDEEAVALAERLLPKALFEQYYNAGFVSSGTVFGDLDPMWDETLVVPDGNIKFWIHPNAESRLGDIVHGIDFAKQKDYTVVYSVNGLGQCVGFMRFRQTPYTTQVSRIKQYMDRFFAATNPARPNEPGADNLIRYDATGVGVAVGDMLAEAEIDAAITPVTFTNKSKSDMVTRTIMAIESGWHRAPRIPQIEHEMSAYELKVTKTGLHSYAASDGENDDIVSAIILAISAAFQSAVAGSAERVLENAMSGDTIDGNDADIFAAYADVAAGDETFFDGDGTDDDFDFDEETA